MGSIAVDKGIAKLSNEPEFYKEFDPDKLAQHLLDTAENVVRDITEETIREAYPELWENAPSQVRKIIHARVQAQLPAIIGGLLTNSARTSPICST